MRRRTRLRYDRLTALLVSTGVTVFAFLAGVGTFGAVSVPTADDGASQDLDRFVAAAGTGEPAAGERAAGTPTPSAASTPAPSTPTAAPTPAPTPSATPTRQPGDPDGSQGTSAIPADSGTGRRIVFDQRAQRVWLIDADNKTERSYLVSGSVTDNLDPGSYRVYSRSRYAVGVDDSGTMQYFVRFTRGQNAAIGFHDIPIDDGRLVQTSAQLGTPQSHGCIRQLRDDAIKLWDFAPVGTRVVVV